MCVWGGGGVVCVCVGVCRCVTILFYAIIFQFAPCRGKVKLYRGKVD